MTGRRHNRRWLEEHLTDAYVKRARQEGLRSRAVYKLREIDSKDRLLRPGMIVVDLGAAPGGWSEYAAQRVGGNGRVIALDLLPMDPIAGVTCLQGDFGEHETLERLVAVVGEAAVDLVLSDMAPNLSGVKVTDQARALQLAESALALVGRALAPGGDFLVKMFQGEGSDLYLRNLRKIFGKVLIRKPMASRSRSAEFYVLARNYIV